MSDAVDLLTDFPCLYILSGLTGRSSMKAHRRGFVRNCFGFGAGLAALPLGSDQAVGSGKVESPNGLIVPRMSEYEHILSHTNSMHILGNPRSWSLVSQGLH